MNSDPNSSNPFQPPVSPQPTQSPKKPLYKRVLFGCLWSTLGFLALMAVIGSLLGPSSNSTGASPTSVPVATAPTQLPAEKAEDVAKENEDVAKEKESVAQEEKRQREVAARELQETEKRNKVGKLALSKLRSNTDEVENVTWYEHRNTPEFVSSRSNMWLYFGKTKTGVTPLRLKITYVSDDWLFIEKYIFKVNGETYTIDTDFGDVKRDNEGGKIWEWYDQPVSGENLGMIQEIIKSDRAILRYDGQQYHDDRDITSKEKQAMKDVLAAYAFAEETF